jgi:2-polyprenyl-3-methyl-5-hydroxy-6-metoxy-1,4-benzoquinol methylase
VTFEEFVLAELPGPPARVLEVGCGDGDLARGLAAAGYEVLAIDPQAPEGSLFRRTTIEELDEHGPFTAVVASRSLHHVHHLEAALDKVHSLLAPGGRIVIDDFAWERLDEASAAAVGIDHAAWRDEHSGLHTSAVMLDELARRFPGGALTWTPYLHREAHGTVDERTERELIAAGELAPIGFRYVGSP